MKFDDSAASPLPSTSPRNRPRALSIVRRSALPSLCCSVFLWQMHVYIRRDASPSIQPHFGRVVSSAADPSVSARQDARIYLPRLSTVLSRSTLWDDWALLSGVHISQVMQHRSHPKTCLPNGCATCMDRFMAA